MARFVIGKDATNGTPAMFQSGVVDKEKLGLTIDSFIGDVVDGVYSRPDVGLDPDFSGITAIDDNGMRVAFYGKTFVGNYTVNFSNLTSLGTSALQSAFQGTNIVGADLSGITEITQQNALAQTFYNCSYLHSVDISNLEHVNGRTALAGAFAAIGYDSEQIDFVAPKLKTLQGIGVANQLFYSSGVLSASFPLLREVDGQQALQNAFYYCDMMHSLDMPQLSRLDGTQAATYLCRNCTAMNTPVHFYSLSEMDGLYALAYAFQGSSIPKLYFWALRNSTFNTFTNQLLQMTNGTTGVEIHFPANLQSTIESAYGSPADFGSGNDTVLYDLPSTLLLNDQLVRCPIGDTATSLCWGLEANGAVDLDAARYYTSGTTDPQVSDTLYSDDACTQSYGTITSATSL